MIRYIAIALLVSPIVQSTNCLGDEASASDVTSVANTASLTVDQMIALLDGPQESIPNLSGRETFVELYLWILQRKYKADSQDEEKLLAAMRDERRPLERRLCISSCLLDLKNEQAQQFVVQCLDGKYGESAREEATFVLVRGEDDTGMSWRKKQMLRLVNLGSSGRRYDNAWSALCRRISELKLQEAVDPLIGVLRRTPTDRAAALALGKLGDRRAIPILLNTLEHNGQIQEFHMYALRELEAPQLPAILIRHLDNYKCVDVLGGLGAKEAITPLKNFVSTSSNEYVRGKARLALARLSATDQKDLAKRLMRIAESAESSEEKMSAIGHVSATGQQWVVPKLLKIAKTSDDRSVVHNCLRSLGQLGGDEAVVGLISLFDHDFSNVPTPSKGTHNAPRQFDRMIMAALNWATDEDFGNDKQAWRRYVE